MKTIWSWIADFFETDVINVPHAFHKNSYQILNGLQLHSNYSNQMKYTAFFSKKKMYITAIIFPNKDCKISSVLICKKMDKAELNHHLPPVFNLKEWT